MVDYNKTRNKTRKRSRKRADIKSKIKTKKKQIYNKNDYLSGDGMLTAVWGPSMWHYLHIMSFNYPNKPTLADKKNYRNFILNLQNVLPCKYCRENLKKNFKFHKLTMAVMKNRHTFSKYIYELHEIINNMLGKKSNLSYCDVRDRYEHFRSRCTIDDDNNSKNNNNNNTNNNDNTKKAFSNKRMKKYINKSKNKTKKEKGCTEPLYGKKSKCILKIVPQDEKCKTIQIDKKCIKRKKN